MPDVQEVFRMTTQKIRPDEGFVDRQLGRQRQRARNHKLGAMALVGAIGIVALVSVIRLAGSEERSQPADPPSPAPAVGAQAADYTLDLETGEKTPLPAALVGESGAGSFAVSPDGSTLAFLARGDDGNSQIFVAELDGTERRQVTHESRGAGFPAWSPDGTAIAYEGYGDGTVRNLFVVDVATGVTTQATFETGDGAQEVFGTQFTPDGSGLVYNGGDKGYGIRIVSLTSGKSTLLVGGGGNKGDAGNGLLSPDGSLLTYAFSEDVPGWPPDRWIANADGSGPRLLVKGGPFLECRSWSPDGTRIACTDFTEVVIVDVATGETTTVGEGGVPTWLDDHTLLIDA